MKDFEQKLVCLLGILPSQEVPLSQLPKEYYERSGKAAATTITIIITITTTTNNNNNNRINAMTRPRDYRCKKMRFLLDGKTLP